ncbi:hypothetical protein Ciccas_008326 [Cichlidogyrus casuarinus]|uniref:V-SNARE coiled-coil homology domain-containing protein n=1 Tax=Cichlidogyrus casuarinus TaxID=1844966 RepID=A0ABD2Q0S6_9PLAT
MPTLTIWVGTKLGSVIMMTVSSPEQKNNRQVSVAASGYVYRLHGEINSISFLDAFSGEPVLAPSVKYNNDTFQSMTSPPKTPSDAKESAAAKRLGTTESKSSPRPDKSGQDSPTCSGFAELDRNLAVICSDRQIRVIALPSQNCLHKTKLAEGSAILQSKVLKFSRSADFPVSATSAYLICYLSTGHFVVYSLPSLKILMDAELPVNVVDRLPKLVTFGQGIQGSTIYSACSMQNPTEVMKISWSADFGASVKDMVADLFIPRVMPEAPKKNFFKSLFGTASQSTQLDRDELFGEESAGKSAIGTTSLVSNNKLDGLNSKGSSAVSDIGKAKMAALERGEKLAQVEERTEEMMNQAKAYSKTAAMLAAKYEKQNKKWTFSK